MAEENKDKDQEKKTTPPAAAAKKPAVDHQKVCVAGMNAKPKK